MIRPVVTNESLGIRLHDVNRQRAVDRAIERLRHGLHADWHYLTSDDHAALRWILGKLWSTTSRQEWESFHFSKLSFDQARRLVMLSSRMRSNHARSVSSMEMVADVVRQATAGTALEESIA